MSTPSDRLPHVRGFQSFAAGAAVAAPKEGWFFAVMLPPERYTFSVENDVPRSIEVQAGMDVYLRLDWNHQAGATADSRTLWCSSPQARQEMRYLSYIESKHIRLESVSQHDPREPEEHQLKRRSEP